LLRCARNDEGGGMVSIPARYLWLLLSDLARFMPDCGLTVSSQQKNPRRKP
jgi:hypothetical protein